MTVSFYVLNDSIFTTAAGGRALARQAVAEGLQNIPVTVVSELELAGLGSAFEYAGKRLCVPPAGYAAGSASVH